MSRILLTAAAALFLTTTRVSAHHAFEGDYDPHRHVAVSGTVTKIRWVNPHAWLYVEATDKNGRIVSWSFEMCSPSGLMSKGWKKDELKPGDQITVEGFGARNGTRVANTATVTFPDGRKLYGGFAPKPSP